MDQWILFTHHSVKLNIHRNVGLMRIFNKLERKQTVIAYSALMQINTYAYKIK